MTEDYGKGETSCGDYGHTGGKGRDAGDQERSGGGGVSCGRRELDAGTPREAHGTTGGTSRPFPVSPGTLRVETGKYRWTYKPLGSTSGLVRKDGLTPGRGTRSKGGRVPLEGRVQGPGQGRSGGETTHVLVQTVYTKRGHEDSRSPIIGEGLHCGTGVSHCGAHDTVPSPRVFPTPGVSLETTESCP